MPVDHVENIVRGIFANDWDKEEGRIRSSFFKGQNISVNRLAVIPLQEQWDLLYTMAKPPERELLAAGEINVGTLHGIGFAHDPSTPLSVEPKPIDGNRSHAEIPEIITRGLARKIIPRLRLHNPPPA